MYPEFEKHYLDRARQTHRLLGTRLLRSLAPLNIAWANVEVPGNFASRPSTRELHAGRIDEIWGTAFDHSWFLFTGEIPAEWGDAEVVAWIDLGTEGLVYDRNGNVMQGISPGRLYENTAWRGTRPLVDLGSARTGDRSVEFWVQASCSGHPSEERRLDEPIALPPLPNGGGYEGRIRHASIGVFDRAVWDLYMDLEVLLDLGASLPPTSVRRAKVLRHIGEACDFLGRAPEDPARARAALRPALEKPACASDLKVHAIGHGHLDTAWLWTASTGRQKCARTAANQLRLMDEFPEHVFGLSAALHYQWLKEDHPELFERVRARVEEGRWEVHGAVWVEADAHLPSGESLVRQFLHGARWFRQAFGQISNFLWLPDVFGYAGSLPGIMRHCGADALVTQKISWGQFHPFPHHAFRWRGIDGSEAIAYFPPENAYSTSIFPSELRAGQERCAERDRLDDMMSLFGYCDGGGGPHAKHLERARRCANLEGCPPVKVGKANDFLDILRSRAADLELWEGPFYLENHRGTFTTHGYVKWANRRLEQLLQGIETLWSAAPAAAWPAEPLDDLWKIALINQFHDIIPGSSIAEVYEVTRAEYRSAFESIDKLAASFADRYLAHAPDTVTFFNSLPYAWRDIVELPAPRAGTAPHDESGTPLPVEVDDSTGTIRVEVECAPLDFATLRMLPETGARPAVTMTPEEPEPQAYVLENALVRYEFDPEARLIAALDKTRNRSWIPAGQGGNVFSLYNDFPCEWDAWNLDLMYENERIAVAAARQRPSIETSPVRQTLKADLHVGNSAIRQTISLCPGSMRLDFETEIDWHEDHRHLRVSFPVDIRSSVASYEIPYGHIQQPTHRNTGRDLAMFEHAAHRFVDLSDATYGVALLNDGKYGHKVHGNVLDLALLRSPIFPDPTADRGLHRVRFALFPHAEPLTAGTVLAEASCFNRAPFVFPGAVPGPEGGPELPVELLDTEVSLEALKRTEDGDAWLLRLVERRGRHACARGKFRGRIELVETDGLEMHDGQRLEASGEVELRFSPFQIRSWKIYASAEGQS